MDIESLINEACTPLELSEDDTTCYTPVKPLTGHDIKNMMDYMNFESYIKHNKLLLKAMTQAANCNVIDMVMPFKNNDVPIFLKKLDKFEKESRDTCLIVK